MGCRDDQEDTVESVQLSDELTELVKHMYVHNQFLYVSCRHDFTEAYAHDCYICVYMHIKCIA